MKTSRPCKISKQIPYEFSHWISMSANLTYYICLAKTHSLQRTVSIRFKTCVFLFSVFKKDRGRLVITTITINITCFLDFLKERFHVIISVSMENEKASPSITPSYRNQGTERLKTRCRLPSEAAKLVLEPSLLSPGPVSALFFKPHCTKVT